MVLSGIVVLLTSCIVHPLDISAGELDVKLPGSDSFMTIKGGETFDVPANSKFQVNVKTITDYCCSYIKGK